LAFINYLNSTSYGGTNQWRLPGMTDTGAAGCDFGNSGTDCGYNVDPASTMQVVNALIQADKDFDLIVLPGKDHGAGETPYAARRRSDFFVSHLLGVEPRGM
jgi:ABC-type sugar transport system substrate-binding protein